MKKINYYSFFLALLIILFPGCSSTRESRDVLYQTSTFNALLAGVFNGNITYNELKKIKKYLENLLPKKNIILGIKIKGVFSYKKTRSVQRQNKPYPPIAEVI